VTGCFSGKHREHAGIPRPDTDTVTAFHLVADIEAMTGGAQIGAGAASQAFAINCVPEGIVEILIQNRFDFMCGNF